MYPPLRVFDVISKTASFTLPDEGVAHPSPYLYFDTSGGEVDATIDGATFIYAAELIIVKLDGGSTAAVVAPSDWLTPGATELTDFATAPSGSSWRVLIDGITKLVVILSASTGGGGTGTQPALLKFSGTLTQGAGVTRWYGDDPDAAGHASALGYPWPRSVTMTDLYLHRATNTSDQPQNYAILKNGAPTALVLPNQLAGATGVVHIGAQSVSFAENDLIDFSAQVAAGNGAVVFAAMAIGFFGE